MRAGARVNFFKSNMILALESSCDESAVALFDPARGLGGEWVHSQIALHQAHGGVVPDMATREHLRHLVNHALDNGWSYKKTALSINKPAI